MFKSPSGIGFQSGRYRKINPVFCIFLSLFWNLFWHGDAAGNAGGIAVLLFDTHLRLLWGMRCLCWKVLIKFLIHLLSEILFGAVKLK
jgi:hypothetical protein